MKTQIKILNTLVIAGCLAGTAFAGPSTSEMLNQQRLAATLQAANTTPVSIALFRSNAKASANVANCPMIKKESTVIPSNNPKSPTPTTVTSYKHDGCVTKSDGTMGCKGSTKSCATMLQGN